jgi:hypothetical protein
MKHETAVEALVSPKLPMDMLTVAEGVLGSGTYAAAGRVNADEGM